jgi:hypothetical protein
MATLEHELTSGRQKRPGDHHVFVSGGGRRRRALRAAGLVAGALALVWLVALGLALAGSTRLPGLPVPDEKPVAARHASPASTRTAAPARSLAGAHVTPARPAAAPPRLEPQRAAPSPSPARPVPAIPPVTRAAPVTPSTASPAVTPRQGWARRGSTAPPGQTRRSEPTPRGTGRPPDAGTTSTTHGNGHGKG